MTRNRSVKTMAELSHSYRGGNFDHILETTHLTAELLAELNLFQTNYHVVRLRSARRLEPGREDDVRNQK